MIFDYLCSMKRTVIQQLIDWKNRPNRKPLILQGARQVGKTCVLKHLGATAFDDMAYFSFDKQPELKPFFEKTKDPSRILQFLESINGKPILPQKTLIVFDEIQECNEALNSLKYFCEEKPEYAIAAAGSLLGVALSRGKSFPVGKVNFMPIYPLSFSEFLQAADPKLSAYLAGIQNIVPIPDIFFSQLTDRFRQYMVTGGMPEVISIFLATRDITVTREAQMEILNAYMLDFSKHAENKDIAKINYVWNSIPSQLARENKKFLYQAAKPGARAREYEDALQWLMNAGLAHRVLRSTKPALPLSAYDDLSAFKFYMHDVGLLGAASQLDPAIIQDGDRLFTEFKGALSENFVLQELVSQYEAPPRYWSSGNTAEVDFLIQHQNDIIPCEVKSGANVQSKSMKVYDNAYHPALRIRYSLQNLELNGNLLNIPLFMAGNTRKLVEWAVK